MSYGNAIGEMIKMLVGCAVIVGLFVGVMMALLIANCAGHLR